MFISLHHLYTILPLFAILLYPAASSSVIVRSKAQKVYGKGEPADLNITTWTGPDCKDISTHDSLTNFTYGTPFYVQNHFNASMQSYSLNRDLRSNEILSFYTRGSKTDEEPCGKIWNDSRKLKLPEANFTTEGQNCDTLPGGKPVDCWRLWMDGPVGVAVPP